MRRYSLTRHTVKEDLDNMKSIFSGQGQTGSRRRAILPDEGSWPLEGSKNAHYSPRQVNFRPEVSGQKKSNVSSKLLTNLPAIDQSQSLTRGPSGVTLKSTLKKGKKAKIVGDKFLASLPEDAREGLQKILKDSRSNHEAYEKSLRVPRNQQPSQQRHRSADMKLRG